MRKLLTQAGFKNVPNEPNWNDCKPEASKAEDITVEIYKLLNGLNPKPKGWITDSVKAKDEIRRKDTSWRFSKLAGLRMLKWLNDLPQWKANKAMKEMYLYASSQTNKSSVYYKVY